MQNQTNEEKRTARAASHGGQWLDGFFQGAKEGEGAASGGISALVKGGAWTCIAVALVRSPLLFSVNPLGLALLCAAQSNMVWLLLGVMFGFLSANEAAWMTGDVRLYPAAVALIVVLRLALGLWHLKRSHLTLTSCGQAWFGGVGRALKGWLFAPPTSEERESPATHERPPLFREGLSLRVMISLLAAIVLSVGNSVLGDYSYYDLYGAVVYLLLTPLLTLLFSGVWQRQKTSATARVWYLLGCLAIFFFACYGGRDIALIGVSLVLTVAATLALVVTERYGALAGGVVAFLGGLALDARCIWVLLVLSLVYAAVRTLLGKAASGGALLAALFAALTGGGAVFLWETLPSLAVGTMIFSVVLRLKKVCFRDFSPVKSSEKVPEMDENALQIMCEQGRNDAICARISAIAGAFGSLAEVFRALGEARGHPEASEIRAMMDEIFDGHCPRCLYRHLCWTDEYDATAQGVGALSRQLAAKPGASVVECLPEPLRRRCPHLIGMMEELHYRIKCRQLAHEGGVEGEQFARSYESIAQLLRDLLHEDVGTAADEFCWQADASRRAAEQLAKRGIHPRQLCVLGRRRVRVRMTGISPAALTVKREELRQILGEACGVTFDKVRYDGSDDGCLSLVAAPSLVVDYAHAGSAADEGKVGEGRGLRAPCGDSLRVFEREDGMLYVLLCDGMGAGRSAALTSGPAALFLERVLQAGVSVGTALRMLNHYLRSRAPEEECSSTVDLLAVDLYTGRSHFIKSGAAVSLVVRRGRIYRISSPTVPLGILQAVDAQVTPFELEAGDAVIMMSDGVTDTPDESGADADWLTAFLESAYAKDAPPEPEVLVFDLIAAARRRGSCDDASAVCLHLGSAQEQSA